MLTLSKPIIEVVHSVSFDRLAHNASCCALESINESIVARKLRILQSFICVCITGIISSKERMTSLCNLLLILKIKHIDGRLVDNRHIKMLPHTLRPESVNLHIFCSVSLRRRIQYNMYKTEMNAKK